MSFTNYINIQIKHRTFVLSFKYKLHVLQLTSLDTDKSHVLLDRLVI